MPPDFLEPERKKEKILFRKIDSEKNTKNAS